MRVVLQTLRSNRFLLRVVAGHALFIVVEYSVWVAMLVYAYAQGGATAAGVIAVVQLIPAALVAPLAAVKADRSSPVVLFLVGCGVQLAGMAIAAVAIIAGTPALIAYAGAVLASAAVTAIRPAEAALLPTLARTADELTAANVALAAIEAVGVALAGLLTAALLTFGPGQVFAAGVLLISVSALAVVRLPSVGQFEDSGEVAPASVWSEMRDGAHAMAKAPGARTLVALLTAQDVVLGALDVLFVVLAVAVLHRDESWVGYLNTAFGVGGIAAGSITVLLIGRRLPAPILAATLVVGVSLILTALTHDTTLVVALLALMGGARSMLDLATRTLLQRSVPLQIVGRVFGLVEGLTMAGLAVGSIMVSALVAIGGARAALIGTGAILPIVALLSARRLLILDRDTRVPIVEIGLLRSIELFALLPPPAMEAMARALEPRRLEAGEILIKEGTPGEHYYAIADGTLEVSRAGAVVRQCRRGSGVGEIALLRSVPRTATVTASTDSLVYALDRDSFLIAVLGHAPVRARAAEVVDRLLLADETPPEGSGSSPVA